MSIKINHELPLPEILKSQYPLSPKLKEVKKQRDEEIRRIFTGESDKFIVLVGPCSAFLFVGTIDEVFEKAKNQ